MLASLSIRNFVLIDRLDLEFSAGLCVLTGETGAGKSILLDALGLAIGARADASAVRGDGSDEDGASRAAVTASFELPAGHRAFAELAALDIAPPADGEPLVLRRTVSADGRSRAFIDDQPVSVGALRQVGETLVEIEGQFASHGLLDPASHRATLDAFGGLAPLLAATRAAWDEMRSAEAALAEAKDEIARISGEGEYLRHVHAELAEMDPQEGEDMALAESRTLMMNGEKIVEAVELGLSALAGKDGVQGRLARALRALERANEQSAGLLKEALEALDRTANEAAGAEDLLHRALRSVDQDPGRLEQIEERLFALRALARKHNVDVDALPSLMEGFARKIAKLDGADRDITALEEAARAKRTAYREAAGSLSAARKKAAAALDAAIADELPHLRLERARFATAVVASEGEGGRDGIDQVRFEVATNPGQPPGPVDRVASGGELARLLLALKVVLSRANRISTLVFDEVDAGVGGATAAAVAERLYRLAEAAQVLVVTHSPQVAARGVTHLRVQKTVKTVNGAENTTTAIAALDDEERREEIARMLAGATVTAEARAAADRLMAETAG